MITCFFGSCLLTRKTCYNNSLVKHQPKFFFTLKLCYLHSSTLKVFSQMVAKCYVHKPCSLTPPRTCSRKAVNLSFLHFSFKSTFCFTDQLALKKLIGSTKFSICLFERQERARQTENENSILLAHSLLSSPQRPGQGQDKARSQILNQDHSVG